MIPLSKQNIDYTSLGNDLEQIFKSGWWTMGRFTQQLEKEFAEYKDVKHAIAVSSCSAGLHLAVKALYNESNISNVLTTPMTFCSTVNSIILNNATPIFHDIDPITKCLKHDDFEDRKKLYFQGIVLVHFAGYPCDMDIFDYLKEKYNIWIIEDCAHAVEAKCKNKHVGTFGDIGVFSFNPIKNLAAPEMGMVITNDDEIAEKIRLWRLHGLTSNSFDRINKPGQYDVIDLGYKYNCTDIESIVALHSLKKLEDNWYRREEIWQEYCNAFNDFKTQGIFDGDYPNSNVVIINDDNTFNRHGLHLYQIEINNRDKFIEEMRKKNIFCGIHYKPIHTLSYYKDKFNMKNKLPIAEMIGETTVSLPLGPGMSDNEVDYVIGTMEKIFERGNYLF